MVLVGSAFAPLVLEASMRLCTSTLLPGWCIGTAPMLTSLDDVTRWRHRYYDALAARLVKEHKRWQRINRKNELALELKGELHEEKQKEQDEMNKKYEKLLSNTTTLSDLLDQPMPELPEEEDELLSSMNIDMSNPFKDMEGATSHLWEDTETQEFYENCTDLRIHVPEILCVIISRARLILCCCLFSFSPPRVIFPRLLARSAC